MFFKNKIHKEAEEAKALKRMSVHKNIAIFSTEDYELPYNNTNLSYDIVTAINLLLDCRDFSEKCNITLTFCKSDLFICLYHKKDYIKDVMNTKNTKIAIREIRAFIKPIVRR